MADRIVVGDTPRLSNTFEVSGVATDPTTVTLDVTDPSGNTATYTYAGATITRASAGVFYKDVTVDEAGLWTYEWTGTGTAADVAVRSFTVHAASVDTYDVLTFDEAASALKIGGSDITKADRLQQAITAVSRRLDDEYGPIVKRTVALTTYTPAAWDLWVEPSPIYSTPAMTITEYDSEGVAQVLTLETFDTKPEHGYRLEPRSGLGGGYKGRIRRTEGSIASTWGTVRVTYDAGRYSDTGTVDPVFKEAASRMLVDWWRQVLPTPAPQGTDVTVPGFQPAAFVIPDGVIPVSELAPRSVLA